MKKLSRYFIPNLGTLIILGLFLWAQAVGAFPRKGVITQSATLPALINYQGRLNDASGDPVPDGSYTMTFRLYSPCDASAAEWTEIRDVTVSNGLFNVMLGEVTDLPAPFPSDPVCLGVKVGTDAEMTPRERLGSVPFAMQALTVSDGSITTVKLADGAVTTAKLNVDNGLGISGTLVVTGNVGIGTMSPVSKLHVSGGNVVIDRNRVIALRSDAGSDKSFGGGFWLAQPSSLNDMYINVASDSATRRKVLFGTSSNEQIDGTLSPTVAIEPLTGKVGIGTVNPSFKLEVAGKVFSSIGNSGGGYYMTAGNGTKGHLFVTDRPCDDTGAGGISGAVEIIDNGGARLCFKGGE